MAFRTFFYRGTLSLALLATGCSILACMSGGEPSTATTARSAKTRPKLPPEPPPRPGESPDTVKNLEAKLLANPKYQVLWTPENAGDLPLIFTAVSELLAHFTADYKASMPTSLADSLEKRGLMDTVGVLTAYQLNAGVFPEPFSAGFKAALDASASSDRLGVWGSGAGGDAYDYSALAAWSNPESASYLRELIRARTDGANGWENCRKTKFLRPWLACEAEAYERLALLDALTPQESELVASLRNRVSLGEEFQLGDFGYRVDEVYTQASVGSSFAQIPASEGGVFLLVEYTIENRGNATATVMADDFLVIDARGRRFQPSSNATTALLSSEKRDFMVSQLQPGLKHKAITAFEVPADVPKQGYTLVVPEKGISANRRELHLRQVSK